MRRIIAIFLSYLMLASGMVDAQVINTGAHRKIVSSTPPLSATCVALGLTSPVTTSPIDTTGAKAIVFSLGFFNSGFVAINITDNKSNGTATQLTGHNGGGTSNQIQYYLAPTVGTGHTFTVTATGSATYAASFCIFPSGTVTAFDAGTDAGSGAASSTCQTGSINPGAGSHWVVSSMTVNATSPDSVDSGLTLDGTVPTVGGDHFGIGIAHINQSPGAAINPTWTASGASQTSCSIASFH